jgi:hypothetical protein
MGDSCVLFGAEVIMLISVLGMDMTPRTAYAIAEAALWSVVGQTDECPLCVLIRLR